MTDPSYTDETNFVIRRLREWGAEGIGVFENPNRDKIAIDFWTPMPGDQPIMSAIVLNYDGNVKRSTVRYGVLDKNLYDTHPTHDGEMLKRLGKTVLESNPPKGTSIIINYGDIGRQPRPHVLTGWMPPEKLVSTDNTVIQMEDIRDINPRELMDFIVLAGKNIMREFKGEWQNSGTAGGVVSGP